MTTNEYRNPIRFTMALPPDCNPSDLDWDDKPQPLVAALSTPFSELSPFSELNP